MWPRGKTQKINRGNAEVEIRLTMVDFLNLACRPLGKKMPGVVSQEYPKNVDDRTRRFFQPPPLIDRGKTKNTEDQRIQAEATPCVLSQHSPRAWRDLLLEAVAARDFVFETSGFNFCS